MSEQPDAATRQAEAAFLERHPDLEYVDAYLSDVNGIARGKRLPLGALPRVLQAGLNLPASTLLLDIWGEEVPASGLIFDTGDADHPCHPVPESLRPLPWSDGRGAQLLLAMATPDGAPFHADPRNTLARVHERFQGRGLTPVVATELEFRLFDAERTAEAIPQPPPGLARHGGSQLLGMDELDTMAAVFAEIDAGCRAQHVPADTIIAEQSEGQYEVNLRHVADPLLAADHAVLLKRTIKAIARRHGMLASFMAKPFGEQAGNGLHIHVSLIDAEGRNALAGEDAPGTALRHAIGGLTATMTDATLLFAPHANSYRRFQAGAHVPTAPTWGFDNRTVAVRVPLSSASATRVEHRVAGADANPYLAITAVLAGIDYGLAHALEPSSATRGAAFERAQPPLPATWEAALEAFEASTFIAEYLGASYRDMIGACKRQEQARFRRHVPPLEYRTYLGAV